MLQSPLHNKKLSTKVLIVGAVIAVVGFIITMVSLLHAYSAASCSGLYCKNNTSGLSTYGVIARIGAGLASFGFVCLILGVVILLVDKSRHNKK